MAKLKAARRNKLRKTTFGMPGQRKYPTDTKARARNAKSRAATQQHRKGRISKTTKQRIHAKANRVLKRGR